ncbi:MAG: hypothetical protein WAT39_11105 [Planctomycetota bacterium]
MLAVPASSRRCGVPRRHSPLPILLAAAALLALPLASQAPAGLTSTLQPLAAATTQTLSMPAGLVTFDGAAVLLTPPGQPPRTLLAVSGLVFGSFLLATSSSTVLFGVTGIGPAGSNDVVWHLPLQGPPPTAPLAPVPFNYDATLLTTTTVLLSARTGGFASTNNELLVLDLPTGATQVVASVPGASGPVAIAGNGDVFYATAPLAFPPVPGSVSVLRFPRPLFDAAIATSTVLGITSAQVVMAGFDAVGDLAFDDDGDLLFVDWFNVRVGEISDANGLPFLAPPVLDYGTAGVAPTALQFVPGSWYGIFEPFQPANGRLLVHETDFVTTTQVRSVRAQRAALTASLSSPIGAGPFDLMVSSGPPGAIGVLAFAAGSPQTYGAVNVPGFEQPLWWNQALLAGPITVLLPFDATGNALLTVTSPGFAPTLAATVQVAFVSPTGVLGSTAALPLLLGP